MSIWEHAPRSREEMEQKEREFQEWKENSATHSLAAAQDQSTSQSAQPTNKSSETITPGNSGLESPIAPPASAVDHEKIALVQARFGCGAQI